MRSNKHDAKLNSELVPDPRKNQIITTGKLVLQENGRIASVMPLNSHPIKYIS